MQKHNPLRKETYKIIDDETICHIYKLDNNVRLKGISLIRLCISTRISGIHNVT